MKKRLLFDIVITIALATLLVAISIGNGILAIENRPLGPLVVQKFQWTTIMTYQFLIGIFMAWILWQHETPIGEPMTYVLAPIVLYCFFKGGVLYYAALLALAHLTLWRTLHRVRHAKKRTLERIKEEITV